MSGGPVVPPKTASTDEEWTFHATTQPLLLSMEQAKVVGKALAGGKWKWSKPSGDCKRFAYFDCNDHID